MSAVVPVVVRVGDEVLWRGNFGDAPPLVSRVTRMEVTDEPRCKYGREVQETTWALVKANRVVFSLASGNWAYGYQIAPLPVPTPKPRRLTAGPCEECERSNGPHYRGRCAH